MPARSARSLTTSLAQRVVEDRAEVVDRERARLYDVRFSVPDLDEERRRPGDIALRGLGRRRVDLARDLAARRVLLQLSPVQAVLVREPLEEVVGDPARVLVALVRVESRDVRPELALVAGGEGVPERLLGVLAEEREPGEAEIHLPGPDVLVDDPREAVLLVGAADRALQVFELDHRDRRLLRSE